LLCLSHAFLFSPSTHVLVQKSGSENEIIRRRRVDLNNFSLSLSLSLSRSLSLSIYIYIKIIPYTIIYIYIYIYIFIYPLAPPRGVTRLRRISFAASMFTASRFTVCKLEGLIVFPSLTVSSLTAQVLQFRSLQAIISMLL
jgi:hypothetical protein